MSDDEFSFDDQSAVYQALVQPSKDQQVTVTPLHNPSINLDNDLWSDEDEIKVRLPLR